MFTNTGFWRDLAERSVMTFAQALAAVLIADGTGLLNTAWTTNLSVAGMAALLAILKGVGAYGLDRETGASALTSPPPRVEHGATDVLTILAIVFVVLAILVVIGVI
jgi:hypothetical protein